MTPVSTRTAHLLVAIVLRTTASFQATLRTLAGGFGTLGHGGSIGRLGNGNGVGIYIVRLVVHGPVGSCGMGQHLGREGGPH